MSSTSTRASITRWSCLERRHDVDVVGIELVMIFIALEISSISTYILAGFRRGAAESSEASLKYFLLGSFATAFFLYGMALVFGATGTTNVYGIAEVICRRSLRRWLFSLSRCSVGLGFKVGSRRSMCGRRMYMRARPLRSWR